MNLPIYLNLETAMLGSIQLAYKIEDLFAAHGYAA